MTPWPRRRRRSDAATFPLANAMNARPLRTLLLALALVTNTIAGDAQRSDASLAAGLLGTWEAPKRHGSKKIVVQSTYTKDGLVVGFTTSAARYPDGTTKEIRIRVSARWKVQDGVLFVSDYKTEPPGLTPKGWAQRYKILSLGADTVLFRPLTDGSEQYRRRTRPNR